MPTVAQILNARAADDQAVVLVTTATVAEVRPRSAVVLLHPGEARAEVRLPLHVPVKPHDSVAVLIAPALSLILAVLESTS